MNSRISPRQEWGRGDWMFLALFLLIPIALFVPPALFGHLVVPGDNLNQNLPLRILAGREIATGRFPAWDPLIWSGTPLLAGWNAGALFPSTLLFAIMPVSAAWPINLVLVPFVASCGTYLFARRLRASRLAAGLGALVFSYTGFMSGQMVHIGLAQGTALTPWILVAIEAIFFHDSAIDPRRHDSPRTGTRASVRMRFAALTNNATLGWVGVLGVATAGTVLAGDPRAVSSSAIIAAVYLLAALARRGGHDLIALANVAGGVVLGAVLSAVQWVPGISFLHSSQRSTSAVAFFGSGSLGLREITSFMLAPFLLGGNGSLGLPIYEGGYNLPEVTIGVGIVGLVAFFAYLPEVLATLRHAASRRSFAVHDDSRRRLGVWYVLAALGLVLTLGISEPFGHYLIHVPFFGGERLQNRNAILIDLALTMLVVFFVDDLGASKGAASITDGTAALRRQSARWTSLVPVAATVLVVGSYLAVPLRVESFLRVPGPNSSLANSLMPYLIVTSVLATGVGAFWFFCERWSPRVRRALISVFLCCDVGMFIANATYATAPTTLYESPTPASATLSKDLGNQGRFALYDPLFTLAGPTNASVEEAGVPDINVAQGNASVQGYGSIVNGVYQTVTSTHFLENLNFGVLRGESANTLDLRVFISLPNYFGENIATTSPIPLPDGQSTTAPGTPASDLPARLPNATGPWTLKPNSSSEWRLPMPSTLKRVEVVLGSPASSSLAVALSGPHGVTARRTTKRVGIEQVSRLGGSAASDAVTVTNTSHKQVVVEAVVVVTADPAERTVLDGPLQGALPSSHWVYDGLVGPLVAFRNTHTRGISWLQPANSPTPNTAFHTKGSVRLVHNSAISPQVMVVTSPLPSTLVRSEGYAPGWTARLEPIGGGPVRVLPVYRFGLVQAVNFPVGDYTVTWRYAPSGILEGLVTTTAGLVVMAFLFIAVVVTRRSARRSAIEDTDER